MKLFIIFALFTICLSTPVEQGYNLQVGSQINADGSYSFFFDNNQREGRQFRDETRNSDGTVTGKYGYQDPSGALRIVKYTAGKDGFVATGDGIPVVASAPEQPLVWTGEQPIVVEPAPLVYGSKQAKAGQVLSPQDQQVYLTGEEEAEVREEGLNSEPKADVDSKSDEDSKAAESLVADTSNTPVGLSQKFAKKQSVLIPGVQYSEYPFPQVVSGQRRLVEPVAGVKGKVNYQPSGFVSPFARQHVLYQTAQHTVPVHIQEIVRAPLHSVSSVQNHVVGGLKKPVIQYQIGNPNFVQQQFLSPVSRKQVQVLQPVIGDQRQVQYVLQPVIHQNPGVDQRQFSVQPELQQVFGLGQSNAQVLSGVKGYGVDQRPVVDQRYFSVAQGAEQVANLEEKHDVAHKEVGVVPVVQSGVQQVGVAPVVQSGAQQVGVVPVVQSGVQVGVVPVVQSGVQQVNVVPVVQSGSQQVGVDLVPVVQSSGVQVGVGTDHRQVQVVSGVHDTGKPQVVNQKHVVHQVGGSTDQRDVHLVHGVEGVVHKVVQHLVKPDSVVSVQQQRVNPLVGVQHVIPVERRNVPYEGYFVQQSPQVQVPNQAVVVSPWGSQYGYQLRQPFIQHQPQTVPQQVSVSNLQEYYQSVRESPVPQFGQVSQPVENQYYSQYPSIVQPIQYSGIEPGQEFIRRDGSDVGVVKQPDISVRSIILEQKPGPYAQNYGTKSINV